MLNFKAKSKRNIKIRPHTFYLRFHQLISVFIFFLSKKKYLVINNFRIKRKSSNEILEKFKTILWGQRSEQISTTLVKYFFHFLLSDKIQLTGHESTNWENYSRFPVISVVGNWSVFYSSFLQQFCINTNCSVIFPSFYF